MIVRSLDPKDIAELRPGSYVVWLSSSPTAPIEARRCALEVRDTLLVVGHQGTSFAFLFRKPCSESTVVENVLRYGTGALNIDETRVASGPSSSVERRLHAAPGKSVGSTGWVTPARPASYNEQRAGEQLGRWPSNLVLIHGPGCRVVGTRVVKGDPRPGGEGTRPGGFVDVGADKGDGKPAGKLYGDAEVPAWECVDGCPVRVLDGQSGDRRSAGLYPSALGVPGAGWGSIGAKQGPLYEDTGGASRFFPMFESEAALLDWLRKLIGVNEV